MESLRLVREDKIIVTIQNTRILSRIGFRGLLLKAEHRANVFLLLGFREIVPSGSSTYSDPSNGNMLCVPFLPSSSIFERATVGGCIFLSQICLKLG